jgi:two-component system sensor histidine kinase GlrK
VAIQLNRLQYIRDSILTVDNQIADYEKKLTNALISQMGYENKFLITCDIALYDRFLENNREVNQNIRELTAVTRSNHALQNLLFEIEKLHNSYNELFDNEIRYVQAGTYYPRGQYKQDKDKAVTALLERLKKLRSDSERHTYNRIQELGRINSETQNMTLVLLLSSLALGIVISRFIMRSIVAPLEAVKQKTRRITEGDFTDDLSISSPPEITDLSNIINLMCHKLLQIDKIKADFFSSMSHELRTPITSIKEGIRLLKERLGGKAADSEQQLLTIMAEECKGLINLINSSLDLSKMEAGMMPYKFFPEDIAPLLYKVIEELEPLAQTKNISIGVQVSSELPVIKMDSESILQVLRNLIGNAIKFTPMDGQIKVSTQPVKQGGIQVSVADSGVGIAEEDLENVFDKYQRGSNSSGRVGTGLGLSIVKHIIDAHGGTLWVKSEQGIGSTFFFVL